MDILVKNYLTNPTVNQNLVSTLHPSKTLDIYNKQTIE